MILDYPNSILPIPSCHEVSPGGTSTHCHDTATALPRCLTMMVMANLRRYDSPQTPSQRPPYNADAITYEHVGLPSGESFQYCRRRPVVDGASV